MKLQKMILGFAILFGTVSQATPLSLNDLNGTWARMAVRCEGDRQVFLFSADEPMLFNFAGGTFTHSSVVRGREMVTSGQLEIQNGSDDHQILVRLVDLRSDKSVGPSGPEADYYAFPSANRKTLRLYLEENRLVVSGAPAFHMSGNCKTSTEFIYERVEK